MEDRTGSQVCAEAEGFAAEHTEMARAEVVPAGSDLAEWLRGLDVLVSFESALLSVFAAAHQVGVQRRGGSLGEGERESCGVVCVRVSA